MEPSLRFLEIAPGVYLSKEYTKLPNDKKFTGIHLWKVFNLFSLD